MSNINIMLLKLERPKICINISSCTVYFTICFSPSLQGMAGEMRKIVQNHPKILIKLILKDYLSNGGNLFAKLYHIPIGGGWVVVGLHHNWGYVVLSHLYCRLYIALLYIGIDI